MFVKLPNHPGADARGRVKLHRVVMENHIGRLLRQPEEIHHIDGDKTNNHISNLTLCANHAEHMRLHKKPARKCSRCSEKHFAHGYCSRHYNAWRYERNAFTAHCEQCGSAMRYPRYIARNKKILCRACRWPKLACRICGKPAQCKGLCKSHYAAALLAVPCSKCGKTIRRTGRNHWPPLCWRCRFPIRKCRICGGKHEGHGLCENHYKQWKRGTLKG